ncbi:MAG: hypothetical protein SEPTF4163_003209 [Sporothrix epigloea]
MSPGLMARSRLDPSALDRIDISQMNIHTPPPPCGWTTNDTSAHHINSPPISRSGQPDAGQYFYPGESLGFYSGQDEHPSVFPLASGTLSQAAYSVEDSVNGQSYTSGGGQAFDSFYNGSLGLPGRFGEAQLVGSNAPGFGGYGLNLHTRTGHLNGLRGPPYQQSAQPPPPLLSTTASSCCSQKTQQQRQPAGDSARHTPTSSTNSLASFGEGTSVSKSCCSGSPATASSSSQGSMLKSESVDIVSADMTLSSIPLVSSGSAINGDAMPNSANGHDGLPSQFGVPLSQQVYNSFSQKQGHTNGAPSWYRYSPEYGTITAPLQWSQWRAGLSVTSDSIAQASGSNLQQHQHQHSPQQNQQTYENNTIQPPFVAQQHTGAMLDGSCGSDTAQHDSHMCSCGDGCECVGCLVHPYNNATRNAVQSMWSLMDDASSTASSARTATAATSSRTPLMSQQQQGPSGSEQGFTPSDTSGASDDEVILPAGDFLFVSYPIMGCDGEELTCPCGDDCQCVGCTIHSNAI